jgi:hypothetical protein
MASSGPGPGLIPSFTTPVSAKDGKITNPWYFWLKSLSDQSAAASGNFVIDGSHSSYGPTTMFQGPDSDKGAGATGDLWFSTDTKEIWQNIGGIWQLMIPAFNGDVTSVAGSTTLTLSQVNPITYGTFTYPSTITVGTDGRITNIASGGDFAAAAGSNTWVQYNNSGVLGAVSNFAYSYTTNQLTLTAGSNANTLIVTGGGGIQLDSANSLNPSVEPTAIGALVWGPAGGGGGQTTGRPNIFGYNNGAASGIAFQLNGNPSATLTVTESTTTWGIQSGVGTYLLNFSGVGNVAIQGDSNGDNISIGTGTGLTQLNFGDASGITISTAGFERLIIEPSGDWALAGTDPGLAGQVITSQGSGLPPVWSSASGGVTINDVGGTAGPYNLLFTTADSGSVSTLDVSMSTLSYDPSGSVLYVGGSPGYLFELLGNTDVGVSISGGPYGSSMAGGANIEGGTSSVTGTTAGLVIIQGGENTASGSGDGGSVYIQGGNSAAGNGGSITLTAGTGVAGPGGITMTASDISFSALTVFIGGVGPGALLLTNEELQINEGAGFVSSQPNQVIMGNGPGAPSFWGPVSGSATYIGGSVTINTPAITAASSILLTITALGTVTVPQAWWMSANVPGTSFTITSADPTDTSTFNWCIFN